MVKVSKTTMRVSEMMNVTISVENPDEYFKGFLLKAISAEDGKTMGSFEIIDLTSQEGDEFKYSDHPDFVKYLDCSTSKVIKTNCGITLVLINFFFELVSCNAWEFYAKIKTTVEMDNY